MNHFISVDQLSIEDIFSVMKTADTFQENNLVLNQNLFAANLFFEPSTRTKMSFVVAQKKLGMNVLDFHIDYSSVKKGESLYDTAKTFESIGANMLVIRHPDDTWFKDLIPGIHIPIINGGAGAFEHPTQCMLDLLTIYQEFGSFQNLKVVIAGDIKHSRVAHSNANAFKRMGAQVFLSAAPGFEDPTLDFPYISIDEAVEICDVVMLLRIQHERHAEKCSSENTTYLESFGLTKDRERKMKKDAIIMHPAPINRGVEIDTSLVECKRSRIFKQMGNGVTVRMAIITKLLTDWGITNDFTKECKKVSSY